MNEKDLVILHIGNVDDDLTSGVSVAIPEMVNSQSNYANVLFLNLYNRRLLNSVLYTNYKTIAELPMPFSNPDLVIFHEIYRKPFLRLYKECKRKGIPYIIIPHGGLTKTAQRKKAYKKIPANMLLFNRYFDGAAAIQYLSEIEMKNSVISKNYFIQGNGIKISKNINKEFSNQNKLVFIGRYDVYFKGIDLLLAAVDLYSYLMRKLNIIFDMYGKGNEKDEEYIRNYVAEHSINDIVKIHGPVFGENKAKVLNSADFFIQTSRSEGHPLGIVEALSNGVPVIVTPGTTMSEKVSENEMGFSCDFDPKSIGECIINAFNKKNEIKQLSKRAFAFAKANYDEEVIANKTIQEYLKIVGN